MYIIWYGVIFTAADPRTSWVTRKFHQATFFVLFAPFPSSHGWKKLACHFHSVGLITQFSSTHSISAPGPAHEFSSCTTHNTVEPGLRKSRLFNTFCALTLIYLFIEIPVNWIWRKAHFLSLVSIEIYSLIFHIPKQLKTTGWICIIITLTGMICICAFSWLEKVVAWEATSA